MRNVSHNGITRALGIELIRHQEVQPFLPVQIYRIRKICSLESVNCFVDVWRYNIHVLPELETYLARLSILTTDFVNGD